MSTIHGLDIIQKPKKEHTKIGIMGGTFDPIHYGHLVIAEQIRCEYDLEKIIFIPAGIPPHKADSCLTDGKHRYFMTLLATITNPHFEVSKIELESNEISYTIRTIEKLKKIYREDTELFFITGADAICELGTWKSVDKLSRLCKFIAATRPGMNSSHVDEKIKELKQKYGTCIKKIDLPALAISSTDIRNRVSKGQSIKYLLPEPVEYYVYKNNLYI
ncbi:nicotinate-nucleotide adenylyltransferase [Inediibacterium massiliense]|uniref:nicotinate-nucleotide adenylyltransferase n=1 Tax=Inediibacterium massiliense TaxID=1658111 RepID=UPI0006B50EE4|nr:nicotinate-nucleotide adenylyltransferase [Inediibacterium massiliense]